MTNTKFQTQNKKVSSSKCINYQGYTLLELLIVVSIMVFIFVMGFNSYRDYQRRQALESGVRQVRADLSLAQTYAITGRKPDSSPDNICETTALKGYAFVRLDSDTYKIDAQCEGGNYTVRDSIAMPSDTQITSVSESDTIIFNVLGRGVNRTGDTTIVIRSIAASTTSQIIITKSGEIK
jgi:prepilin-type N-terminal cleavage/methylation domain-containing protein